MAFGVAGSISSRFQPNMTARAVTAIVHIYIYLILHICICTTCHLSKYYVNTKFSHSVRSFIPGSRPPFGCFECCLHRRVHGVDVGSHGSYDAATRLCPEPRGVIQGREFEVS